MKRIAIITAGLIIILLASCEPTDWEYILNGVGDVTDLSVTRNSNNVDFNYKLPDYPLCEFRDDDCHYLIYFYYSPEGSDTETYIGNTLCDDPAEGDPGSISFDMTNYGLVDGSKYTFTVYTIDENYKPSEGVSKTITWE